MLRTPRSLFFAWLSCLCSTVWVAGLAAASEPQQTDAAAHFDAGVQAYKQADYVRAAEAFLAADSTLPSVTALSNALAAARRSGVPLLAARAAERCLTRAGTSEADRRSAESALAEAAPKLARLEISCPSAGCAPQIDGVPLEVAGSYVLPGAHRVGVEGQRGEELSCAAGQTCRIELTASSAPAVASADSAAAAEAPLVEAPEPLGDDAARTEVPRWKRRLPLAVFVSSGAGALVLAALATWSGVEALDAKRSYDREHDDWSDVRKLARRSDLLLAGSVVLAGTAIATAIWWVDWDAQSRSHLALLPGGGAALTLRRRF